MKIMRVVYPDMEFELSSSGDAIMVDHAGESSSVPLPGCTNDLTEQDKIRIKDRISKITGNS